MQDDGNHTLVAKATDTSGQYSKATMTFTIANGQLIRNGSFEKGYGVGWSNTQGMQIGTILGQTAYDGTKMAKFNGTGSQMSVGLYQSVAIPANAVSGDFELRPPCGNQGDFDRRRPRHFCGANPQQSRSNSKTSGNIE